MRFQLFQYPIPTESDLNDLNRFLASNRVVSVTREIVNGSTGAILLFIVETASGEVVDESGKKRVDYREILQQGEFEIFDALRKHRKALAENEGVPLYSIFTNAQLAEMVTSRATSIEAIAAIKGVGETKGEKYGESLLKVLLAMQEQKQQ
ncbi:MAG: HRDC domain-containing protein [Granulosicoccus sp.]